MKKRVLKTRFFVIAGLAAILLAVFGFFFFSGPGGSWETYQDGLCGVSFQYPSSWSRAESKLPLPAEPMAETAFGAAERKFVFSYVCYDASQYTFAQLMGGSQPRGLQTVEEDYGGRTWRRLGPFAWAEERGSLIIFQMADTAYDLYPREQTEQRFQRILRSVTVE